MTKSAPHTVLADTVGDPFGSLRQRPTSRQERFEVGRALRKQVPRTTLGRWEATDGRRDPVELIRASHQGRLAELIPIRVARMTASPYGFLRGSAVVMAQDVSALPATGITPVICGDAHLGNFGFYASPEGELVLDLNDFDESLQTSLGGLGLCRIGLLATFAAPMHQVSWPRQSGIGSSNCRPW